MSLAAIGSASHVHALQPAGATSVSRVDSDGDHDNSPANERAQAPRPGGQFIDTYA